MAQEMITLKKHVKGDTIIMTITKAKFDKLQADPETALVGKRKRWHIIEPVTE